MIIILKKLDCMMIYYNLLHFKSQFIYCRNVQEKRSKYEKNTYFVLWIDNMLLESLDTFSSAC